MKKAQKVCRSRILDGSERRLLPKESGDWNKVCRLGRKSYLVQNAVLLQSWYGVHLGLIQRYCALMPALLQKNTQEQEGLGPSCGGFSTKIHAVCDALGNPLDFSVTAGQAHDASQALAIIDGIDAHALLADRG